MENLSDPIILQLTEPVLFHSQIPLSLAMLGAL